VSGGLSQPAALALVDGLEERLAAAKGDPKALALGLKGASEAGAWPAALGARLAVEQLPGGRWVVRVTATPATVQPPEQVVMGGNTQAGAAAQPRTINVGQLIV